MTADKIKISIEAKEVKVKKDTFLLDILLREGIVVPTLCHHKDLTPNGACRLCIVEIEIRGRRRLVTSCNYPVQNDIKVFPHSERVKRHRKTVAAMYLGRWPNVPVIQNLARQCGATDKEKFKSELTDENPKACVLCGRCVRACEEFVMERMLDFAGRGIKRHLTMPYGEMDHHCVGCTSCAYVCPTGAISIVDDRNAPADPILIRNAGMKINSEIALLDKDQNRMREVGTTNLVEAMNAYDILPVCNFKFGSHEEAWKIDSRFLQKNFFTQNHPDGCWNGCSMACAKAVDGFILKSGPYKGEPVVVDGPEYETAAACANMGCFDSGFAIEFNFYCDTYGVDTISFGTTMAFVMECYENGVITSADTGGKELRFGARNEVMECLHEMATGHGFGVEVGQGIRWLKSKWISELKANSDFLQDIGMEAKGLEYSEYVCKESVAQQAGYTLAVKGPQHDEAWLIFMDMVNNQMPTFEDKAEALYFYPLWRTWFGLHGLCKLLWNDIVPPDNWKHKPQEAAKIPGHMKAFFEFYEGMLGRSLDEEGMLVQSARVHNLQRIMSRLLGFGTRKDDMPPYRAMGPVTQVEYESRADKYYDRQLKEEIGIDPEGMPTEAKIDILRQYRIEQYNKVVDAAYDRRGWTRNGVPKIGRLKELGIDLSELIEIIKNDQE